ncbi:MAG: hypothetical protein AAGD05_05325 [Bacteroidota bacterium]
MKKIHYLLTLLCFSHSLLSQTPLGSPINGTGPTDYAGWSATLSGDGQRLAVGAIGADSLGRVEVFEYDGNDWQALGLPISGTLASQFGFRVVFAQKNANRLAVGSQSRWRSRRGF